mgnify:CR=1 FL=1
MKNELIEIAFNTFIEKFDEELLEEPIYEQFLSNKERSLSKKMREALNKIPKEQRLSMIKEYLMSSDNDFIDD